MNDKIIIGVRVLFGLFMLVFGINKFMNFLPPPEVAGDGGILMDIYIRSGFLKIIGVLEIVFGLLLIVGKFVPLSLTILIAIMANAAIFNILHDLPNVGPAAISLLMGLFLVFMYRDEFDDLFAAD